jgi:hypothetical protein
MAMAMAMAMAIFNSEPRRDRIDADGTLPRCSAAGCEDDDASSHASIATWGIAVVVNLSPK